MAHVRDQWDVKMHIPTAILHPADVSVTLDSLLIMEVVYKAGFLP